MAGAFVEKALWHAQWLTPPGKFTPPRGGVLWDPSFSRTAETRPFNAHPIRQRGTGLPDGKQHAGPSATWSMSHDRSKMTNSRFFVFLRFASLLTALICVLNQELDMSHTSLHNWITLEVAGSNTCSLVRFLGSSYPAPGQVHITRDCETYASCK